MALSFGFLWFIWLVGVIYDVAVATLGFFPHYTLSERVSADIRIAWFLVVAWAALWIIRRDGIRKWKN